MRGSHRDTKGKGQRERQPFLKRSGVEWRGEKKSTDLGRNVWRSMRKSAGNETSVATGLWVLRQKHPDFEPAFSESALQRAKKKPARRPANSVRRSGVDNEPESDVILSGTRCLISPKRGEIWGLLPKQRSTQLDFPLQLRR
jgi:hypothetical protein